MQYVCKPFNLTERTLVYRVETETGKFVAQFPHTKPRAAESFARFLNENKIFTMKDWFRQPWEVQRNFIYATSDECPILHGL